MAKIKYPKDRVVERVLNKVHDRSEEGLKKFGRPIGDTLKDLRAWLVDIQEELMDAAVYVERVLDELPNENL